MYRCSTVLNHSSALPVQGPNGGGGWGLQDAKARSARIRRPRRMDAKIGEAEAAVKRPGGVCCPRPFGANFSRS